MISFLICLQEDFPTPFPTYVPSPCPVPTPPPTPTPWPSPTPLPQQEIIGSQQIIKLNDDQQSSFLHLLLNANDPKLNPKHLQEVFSLSGLPYSYEIYANFTNTVDKYNLFIFGDNPFPEAKYSMRTQSTTLQQNFEIIPAGTSNYRFTCIL